MFQDTFQARDVPKFSSRLVPLHSLVHGKYYIHSCLHVVGGNDYAANLPNRRLPSLEGLAAIAGPLSVMGAVTIAAAAAIVIAIVFFNAHNNRLRSSDLGYARIYELNGYSNYNYGDLAATGNKVFPFRESWTKEYGSGAIQIP